VYPAQTPAAASQPPQPAPGAAARWCAAQGWPVHPLAAGRKTTAGNCTNCRLPGHTAAGCACRDLGRWCHGFHAATTQAELIDQWWATHPGFGVGVACGPANLLVGDIDAHPQEVPARDRLLPGIPIPDSIDLTGLANGFHDALLSARV
jgi:hypothetical protein